MKKLYGIQLTFFVLLFCFGCNRQAISSFNGDRVYHTEYGKIIQINDYPLYRIDYDSNYRFDEYLKTGVSPFENSAETKQGAGHFACTCFSATGKSTGILGRNYDWNEKASYYIVFTNPEKGYASWSTVDLSFFDYDGQKSPDHKDNLGMVRKLPYYPFDGINEKGLAIGMNAVPAAKSPNIPGKILIGELQLIRLVLDKASNVDEAVSMIKCYNIQLENPPIHYLLSDSSGKSVILEFVKGRMEVIKTANPWQVTTNFVITGLSVPGDSTCWRYNNTFRFLKQKNGNITENEAMLVLKNASISTTRWSAVYNLLTGKIKIVSGRDFKEIYNYSIDLN